MKIGLVGLGKLGMPVAVAIAARGHDVLGFDVNPAAMQKTAWPHLETGPDGVEPFLPYLQASTLRFGTLAQVVEHAEMVLVPVQTPHAPEFEGTTVLPFKRADFDYTFLKQAMQAISDEATAQDKRLPVVIVSTVLPGTIRREILPIINRKLVKVVYSPSFIAMGTVMRDFYTPEFFLFGGVPNDPSIKWMLYAFARSIHETAPILHTDAYESAELAKVAYNTFISLKIAFANVLMEACTKIPGADVDQTLAVLHQANRRLLSPAYLNGGMGDGGGCHPRDNIALSWLARKLDLSFDLFDASMQARERQAMWLADLLMARKPLPVAILGVAFKPGTNITTGSPALLVKSILETRGQAVAVYDPHAGPFEPITVPSVFLIGTRHPEFAAYEFPPGSVVIDPFRYIPPTEGVTVVPLGLGKKVAA